VAVMRCVRVQRSIDAREGNGICEKQRPCRHARISACALDSVRGESLAEQSHPFDEARGLETIDKKPGRSADDDGCVTDPAEQGRYPRGKFSTARLVFDHLCQAAGSWRCVEDQPDGMIAARWPAQRCNSCLGALNGGDCSAPRKRTQKAADLLLLSVRSWGDDEEIDSLDGFGRRSRERQMQAAYAVSQAGAGEV
jgi:hypothetical protein